MNYGMAPAMGVAYFPKPKSQSRSRSKSKTRGTSGDRTGGDDAVPPVPRNLGVPSGGNGTSVRSGHSETASMHSETSSGGTSTRRGRSPGSSLRMPGGIDLLDGSSPSTGSAIILQNYAFIAATADEATGSRVLGRLSKPGKRRFLVLFNTGRLVYYKHRDRKDVRGVVMVKDQAFMSQPDPTKLQLHLGCSPAVAGSDDLVHLWITFEDDWTMEMWVKELKDIISTARAAARMARPEPGMSRDEQLLLDTPPDELSQPPTLPELSVLNEPGSLMPEPTELHELAAKMQDAALASPRSEHGSHTTEHSDRHHDDNDTDSDDMLDYYTNLADDDDEDAAVAPAPADDHPEKALPPVPPIPVRSDSAYSTGSVRPAPIRTSSWSTSTGPDSAHPHHHLPSPLSASDRDSGYLMSPRSTLSAHAPGLRHLSLASDNHSDIRSSVSSSTHSLPTYGHRRPLHRPIMKMPSMVPPPAPAPSAPLPAVPQAPPRDSALALEE
ncbi:hypothetical protein GGF32_006663 [Allomyces javanicus]|nr:hypothetical protein GGF32_006663 [Allomyces javanicus]